ncbi:protein of unknown function [Xenorhabdus doucetiae]|uniref:Uncharacterized protein n=1 Tax=Xenorhabdus doucetiae TaxID=351671 RepID=A0A068QUB4_9GAMM|nr:protein of unknown function [Xenorhabdus doucetiae]
MDGGNHSIGDVWGKVQMCNEIFVNNQLTESKFNNFWLDLGGLSGFVGCNLKLIE